MTYDILHYIEMEYLSKSRIFATKAFDFLTRFGFDGLHIIWDRLYESVFEFKKYARTLHFFFYIFIFFILKQTISQS